MISQAPNAIAAQVDIPNGIERQTLDLKKTLNADFYGALFGTAAAIAIIAVTFIFAPLCAAITLLVIGIISIFIASGAVAIKCIISGGVNLFLDVKEVAPNQNGTSPNSKFKLKLKDNTILRGTWFGSSGNRIENYSESNLVIYFPQMGEPNCIKYGNRGVNAFYNHDTMCFSYRGSNDSSGRPSSMQQNAADGLEVLEAALELGYKIENITLYGASLGGSVAPLVKKLCLEKALGNPALLTVHSFHSFDQFVSGRVNDRIGKVITEALTKFAFWISGLSYDFKTEDWDALGTRNLCVGGGDLDTLIPPDMSLATKLFKANPSRRDTLIIPAEHCDFNTKGDDEYDIISEVLGLTPLLRAHGAPQ